MEDASTPIINDGAVPANSTNSSSTDDSSSSNTKYWSTSTAPFDISSFHTIMWDSTLTTENDKNRWVDQGIDFCDAEASGGMAKQDGSNSGMLSLLAKDFRPWGLTQSHGGPCGVLAAIQAELLCLLLFGKRNATTTATTTTNSTSSSDSSDVILDYPEGTQQQQDQATTTATTEPPTLTKELIREAFAKAIAIVLARAAVMPSATHTIDEQQKPTATNRKAVAVVLTDESGEGVEVDLLRASTVTVALKKPLPESTSQHKRQKMDGTTVVTVPSSNNGKSTTNNSYSNREETILQLARATAEFLLGDSSPTNPNKQTAPLEAFRRPGGVMLLVMSLVACRGQEVIQNEMDDPTGTKLTSNFGHCGQELINLLLTGQAVSNVFDNTLTPSGELTCRGIQYQPTIGYLSQLESLRYCEVGSFFKSPKFPIWVVGSTSHFTILFGESSCLQESESDQLLEKCRRAFKAVEGGEENGFINSQHLETVLKSLDIQFSGDNHYSALAASLTVADSNIILWEDFFKAASRLMTGATIENVLNGTADTDHSKAGTSANDPLLLTNGPAVMMEDQKLSANNNNNNNQKPSLVESDEEMAKRLSSEWEYDSMNAVPTSVAASAPTAAGPVHMEVEQQQQQLPMSDEELARKLQAEWDAEVSGVSGVTSVAAVHGGGSSQAGTTATSTSPQWSNFPDTTNSSIATPETTPMHGGIGDNNNNPGGGYVINVDEKDQNDHKLEFEKYGDSFEMFHYNGLRGGVLTPFQVTRLTPEDAVGASIALKTGNSGGTGDLEDVVRCKWPSCVVNWLGRHPPNID